MSKEEVDYSYLEGMEFDLTMSCGTKFRALLVNIDPTIGITIVNSEDHKIHLRCVRGPDSPLYVDYPGALEEWTKILSTTVDGVTSGYMDLRTIDTAPEGHGVCISVPSSDNCAFN